MKRSLRNSLIALPALAIGCAPETAAPTWNAEVAAVFQRHCVDCHSPGEAGPFPLDSYEAVAPRAAQVRTVIASGFMPPWLPGNPPGSFHGERGLSAAELEVLTRWFDAGVPRGAGEPPVHRESTVDARPPDAQLVPAGPVVVPREGLALLHTLVFPFDGDGVRAVSALRLTTDNPGALHGAAFLMDTSGSGARFDESFAGAGYASPGNMGIRFSGSFGGWVPQLLVAELPPGYARRVPAEADFLVQLHLFPRGRIEEVTPTLGVWLAQEPVERWVTTVAMGALGFELPAGAREVEIVDELVLPVAAHLVGLMPLARYACTRVSVRAMLSDGEPLELLTIEDFDHNWLHPFQYREPVPLAAGTTIELRMSYDNSGANPRNPHSPPRPVSVGMGAGDEMAFLLLDLAPADEGGLDLLEQAHREGFAERLAQKKAQRQRAAPRNAPR